ncbi:hypothetical protein ABFB09_08080 [Dehalogenimonas sp. THU2]|uniref:hypothetical protein n=1 Tax=Dehalogenimonas sp. THU2 TaxID=3151121 RepID=UPI0032185C34
MAKREIYCPYCGKGPYANKGSLRSHFRRCQRMPASGVPEITDYSATTEEDQQSVELPQPGQDSQTLPADEPETFASPPGVNPDELERQIQALVDAKVRSMMSQAEERLSTMMSQSIGMIEQTCEKLPGLVEKQVQTMLGSQDQVVIDQDSDAPATVRPPANGQKAFGNAFSGVDWIRLAAEFLGADPNDPASIIAAVLKKSQQSQKKSEPLNASMMSRGAAHMISMLKNKRVDPISAARVALTMSEDILKMPGIDGSTKSYWIGRKSEAANYLAMMQMEADNKAASAGAE